MIRPFNRTQPAGQAPTSREFVASQSKVQETLNSIMGREILDGRLIENLNVTALAVVDVEHGLGREYRGFIAVRNSSGMTLDESYTSTDRHNTLRFIPSATGTLSLWIF